MEPDASEAGRRAVALTIAGSDSGAGAGIQADLKTFAALGVYGVSVLTVLTAQNTIGVQAVLPVPEDFVVKQLDSVCADFVIGAMKTGALGNAGLVRTVAQYLAGHEERRLVVDPVMISKHGSPLLAEDAVETLKTELLPLATVVTPNLAEAAALAEMPLIKDQQDMLEAAERIAWYGCHAVVVKGGHAAGTPDDLLWMNGRPCWFPGERVETLHTHGTGCTFSAAITACLAQDVELTAAVGLAKQYITGALQHGRQYGRGINPVNHFWQHEREGE